MGVHPKLDEPIEIRLRRPTIASGLDAPAAAAINAHEFFRAFGETFEKLELLFPHYGLVRTGDDAGDFRALTAHMARDLFRGFQVVDVNAPKPYEHSRSNWVALMMLLADVETVKREHSPRDCSDGQALRALITRFPGRWGEWGASSRRERSWRTLKNWLADARNQAKNPALVLWRLAEGCGQVPAMIEVFGSARQHGI